jgi:hypothetical protein
MLQEKGGQVRKLIRPGGRQQERMPKLRKRRETSGKATGMTVYVKKRTKKDSWLNNGKCVATLKGLGETGELCMRGLVSGANNGWEAEAACF